MTRKDYEMIAAAFKRTVAEYPADSFGTDILTTLAEDLAGEFLALNPAFDTNRFLKACGLER